jgi:hypothetical protein
MDDSGTDPIGNLYRQDLEHALYSFCSLVSLINNKKMNIASVFIEILDKKHLLDIYMDLCDHKTKYDAVRSFLTIEPSLQKSKYIKRYINKNVEIK